MKQAIEVFTCAITDPNVKWENEYRPSNQINDSERKKFFTNWNDNLIRKVRDERQSKN